MTVDRNEDVMEMVQETLREIPDASTQELKEKAEEIDDGIAELSARQFNARYPLQVKRQLKAEQKEADPEPDEGKLRSVAREVLLDFARAVAGAEDRAEMIDVLACVDEYVDRVLEAS